jgi:hypothetical protein
MPGAEVFDAASAVAVGGRLWVPGDALGLGLGVFPRLGLTQRVRVLQDYEPLSSRRLGRYLHALAGKAEPTGPAAAPFVGSAIGSTPGDTRLLDAAAVTAIVLPATQVPASAARWRVATTAQDFRVWRNPAAQPRAYLAVHARSAPSDVAALAHMQEPEFDPSRDVVLVGANDLPAPPDAPAAASTQSIVVDEPEHVRVQLDVREPGILVLADAFAPGWRATVDGQERPVWLANALMRGVRVAPGDRQVDFTYQPPGLRLGLAISIAAAAAALLLGLASRRTGHRERM